MPSKSRRELAYSAGTHSAVMPSNPFIPFARSEIDQSIGARFQQVVEREASRIAIRIGERALTYEELNSEANRIAHALESAKSSANTPVAVFGGNDADTIAAILGIYKAGKIYIALDRSFSEAWVRFILVHTAAKIILAAEPDRVTSWLSPGHTLLDLKSLNGGSTDNPDTNVSPDALSQILYTSGTTGQPKGVMDTHRNMLHNTMRMGNVSHISPDDRITLVRPPTSGGGLCNMLLALLNGATLHLVDFKKLGLTSVPDWLQREKITIFHVGATVFRSFARDLTGRQRFPAVRLVWIGSGSIFEKDVKLFKKHFPESLLLHLLSCTETHNYRVYFIDKDSVVGDGPLPVGYAVEDTEVQILDESGTALGVNKIGEIAVRSAYLARGYWKDPALTESKFQNVCDGSRRRLLRTGDIGRLRTDGCLEFLGRKDFQLKIRGHRIQAEEVESALVRLPQIRQAIVTAHKDANQEHRLVAYVVPTSTDTPLINEIRDALTHWLPDYMVPSQFIFMDGMPQSSDGKVDRAALPMPTLDHRTLSTPFSRPTTRLEKVLAKIWSDALGAAHVGNNDSFFELGGDSIIAMKIVSSICRTFPWEFKLEELYAAPTVSSGAQLLARKAENPEQAEQVAALYLEIERLSLPEIDELLPN